MLCGYRDSACCLFVCIYAVVAVAAHACMTVYVLLWVMLADCVSLLSVGCRHVMCKTVSRRWRLLWLVVVLEP